MAHTAHGRRREVRTWPSHAGGAGWFADYRSYDLDLARGCAAMDEVARSHRSRDCDRARSAGRPDRIVLPAVVDLKRARDLGAIIFLHRCQPGAVHIAGMAWDGACKNYRLRVAVGAHVIAALRRFHPGPAHSGRSISTFRHEAVATSHQRSGCDRIVDLDLEPRAYEPRHAARGPPSGKLPAGTPAPAALPRLGFLPHPRAVGR